MWKNNLEKDFKESHNESRVILLISFVCYFVFYLIIFTITLKVTMVMVQTFFSWAKISTGPAMDPAMQAALCVIFSFIIAKIEIRER